MIRDRHVGHGRDQPARRPSHERTNPYIASPDPSTDSASTALTLASYPRPRNWLNSTPTNVLSGAYTVKNGYPYPNAQSGDHRGQRMPSLKESPYCWMK